MGKTIELVRAAMLMSGTESVKRLFEDDPEGVLEAVRSQTNSWADFPVEIDDFLPLYRAAGALAPEHGYGVDKALAVLDSHHLAPLSQEQKAAALLAIIETAGASLGDVAKEALARDHCLDSFEAARRKEVEEARAKSQASIQEIQKDIVSAMKEKRSEIEALRRLPEEATAQLSTLQRVVVGEDERLRRVQTAVLDSDRPSAESRATASARIEGAPRIVKP